MKLTEITTSQSYYFFFYLFKARQHLRLLAPGAIFSAIPASRQCFLVTPDSEL